MPREGHKFSSWSIRSLSTHFNPHAPRGARRRLVVADGRVIKFQSTCPARGTTGGAMVEYTAALPISIHVPREGHDSHKRRQQRSGSHFNPRAPRGARQPQTPPTAQRQPFQSTCPARGTTSDKFHNISVSFISIHVPREGHDAAKSHNVSQKVLISIHVPREGHDGL